VQLDSAPAQLVVGAGLPLPPDHRDGDGALLSVSFWREMSKGERATFRACFGGWALDGMDFQLYSFVIPP